METLPSPANNGKRQSLYVAAATAGGIILYNNELPLSFVLPSALVAGALSAGVYYTLAWMRNPAVTILLPPTKEALTESEFVMNSPIVYADQGHAGLYHNPNGLYYWATKGDVEKWMANGIHVR